MVNSMPLQLFVGTIHYHHPTRPARQWKIPMLVVDLPLWKMMEFVSWDCELPNWMESHKIHVPNHQPASMFFSKKWKSALENVCLRVFIDGYFTISYHISAVINPCLDHLGDLFASGLPLVLGSRGSYLTFWEAKSHPKSFIIVYIYIYNIIHIYII
jgi:hypothetical protein